MMTSVPSGRCGPCASSAPVGRMATAFARSRSRTSSQVMAESSRTVMVRVSYEESRLTARRRRSHHLPMSFSPPEQFNMAEYFLDARIREGRGERPALLTGSGTLTYRDVHTLANRLGLELTGTGIEPEHAVSLALPDSHGLRGAL